MTVTAQLARGIVGQIARTESNRMAVGTVGGRKPAGMTACTVTTAGEVLADRAAEQSSVSIVAAAAGVVDLHITGIGQWRWITVTARTAGSGGPGSDHSHQWRVIRRIRGMQNLPGIGMASQTVTATGRQTGLQRRYRGMAQGTVAVVDQGHCFVDAAARIVTAQAWSRTSGDITEAHVVSAAVNGQILVAVTVQAVGRVRTKSDGINNVLTRAVVTGGTRAGTVGRNIMLDSLDLGPA